MAMQPAAFPAAAPAGPESELDGITKSLLVNTDPDPEGKPDPEDSRQDDAATDPSDLDPASAEEDQDGEDVDDELDGDPQESGDGEEELGAEAGEQDGEDYIDEEPGDTVYEVKANGKTHRVTLDELKRDFSGRQAIELRLQEAAEAKNAAEQELQTLRQERSQTQAALAVAQAILQQDADPEIDWEALYEVDPTEWAHQKALQQAKQERRQSVMQAAQQEKLGEDRQTQAQLAEKIAGEATILRDAVPVFQDPEKGSAHRQKLVKFAMDRYGKHGLTEADIQGVQMAVPLIMLNELFEMDQQKGKTAVKVAKRRRVKRTVRPGTGTKTSEVSQSRKRQESLQKRARETGHPDDVAKLLLEPKR